MKKRKAAADEAIERDALAAGALPRPVVAAEVEMMLAEVYPEAFSRPGWVFEIKFDGYRVVIGRRGGKVTLLSRNGNELTEAFRDVAAAVRELPGGDLVLDGEVVALDSAGKPSCSKRSMRQPQRLKSGD